MKKDDVIIGYEQEKDQIIWDWKKGRYDKTKRDNLLASVDADIAEYKKSKVQHV